MLFFKLLLAGISLHLLYDNNCDLLPNGKYVMHYSMPAFNPLPGDSYLVINNDRFIQYGKGIDSTQGRIRWLYGCGFKLETQPTAAIDSNVVYPFGEPFIELTKGSRDTVNFRITYLGNLHLTVYSGIITKTN